MKRLLAVLLLLGVLSGCTVAQPDATDPTGGLEEVPATTGPALYDPNKSSTDGAVRAFALEDGCTAVAAVGDHVVLFFGNTLRAYTGENLNLVKELVLQTQELPGYPDVQVTSDAMGYYDEVDHAVVMLNGALKEIARVKLPADAQGTLALADTLDTIYYCTEDSIRALNLKTGNSHMLRQQGYVAQALVQNCFGGDILGCEVYNRDKRYVSYINAATGELLGTSDSDLWLQTGGEYYFTQVSDGIVTDYLFGKLGENPRCLRPAELQAPIFTALELGGVFTAVAEQSGLQLAFYDLESGNKTSAVTLNGVGGTVHGSWADAVSGCLWLLVGDESNADTLFCWNLAQTPAGDSTVYTGQRYTADNPDTEGLSRCAQTAADLGSKYGLDIRIGNAPEGCDYELTDEYQVSLIEDGLTALDQALSRYPAEVLAGINQVSDSGTVTVTLVRSIAGERTAVQYWSGKDACIVLELDADMEGRLDNAMYHVLDTFLFNKTSALDQWDELNPKGFRYDMNEQDYLSRQDDKYLTGDDRAFVDSFSMSYPMEDRARIFQYAMSAEGAEVFASKTMQQKLETMGKAIRAAFGWKKSEEIYLWEQHLENSIAYKPKK